MAKRRELVLHVSSLSLLELVLLLGRVWLRLLLKLMLLLRGMLRVL
jgi:hypothetical protein